MLTKFPTFLRYLKVRQCSQNPAINPYPESEESSPKHSILFPSEPLEYDPPIYIWFHQVTSSHKTWTTRIAERLLAFPERLSAIIIDFYLFI
jgi:hypothetical protein